MLLRRALFALGLFAVCGGESPAQTDGARAMVGSWEFSNADRDKICTIAFKADAGSVGMKLDFDRACAGVFPFVREIVGWTLAENDFLRLLNEQGSSVLEFSEVESGVYEAPRPGEGILFIQTAAAAGSAPVMRTAEQMSGEWTVMRGQDKPVCVLTLSSTAAGSDFAVRVRPPCDPFITRFGPAVWQIDRGELLLKSPRGQTWRFEETSDPTTWQRVPEGAEPVLLVRK